MIVSFQDFVPPPRYDGLPWTKVKIEESALFTGPWTQIDLFNIVPVDTDPSSPTSRRFTTDNAVVPQGWYRISFIDAAGDTIVVNPIQNVPTSDINYKPNVGRVARKNLSRTKDQYGNVRETFTSDTTPTDTQVINIIDDVSTEVADVIGDTVPAALIDDASDVLALRTAMQVELNYFSDQVNTGRSIYPQLKEQYEKALAALTKQIEMFDVDGNVVVDDGGASLSPAFAFPQPMSWLTRRM